jgi:hypothetical protein
VQSECDVVNSCGANTDCLIVQSQESCPCKKGFEKANEADKTCTGKILLVVVVVVVIVVIVVLLLLLVMLMTIIITMITMDKCDYDYNGFDIVCNDDEDDDNDYYDDDDDNNFDDVLDVDGDDDND